MEASPAWARCNSCKGDIDFDQTYYVCSVSTCNRKGTELRFCSVECWDVHVPVMRHREAWAEEKRSPTQSQWEREHPPVEEETEASTLVDPATPPPSRPEPSSAPLNETDLPRDILIVVSKLKAYVRARSGMNTSDAVMEVLSDRLRTLCDEGMRHAAAAGRKTLMERDFE
ncbi:MAG TPA: hypothetical protein VLF14_05215 [Candidatus Binatia bacterium]|nr:hypothetical protein [Candidatus Binatia bacterium]